jgi:phosphonate transport system permease protein
VFEGVIGSVGLGWQLQESLSSFVWEEVIVILFAYSSIAIIGELINGKIKSNLT